MHDVFISYSHRNQKLVRRLVSDLQDHGVDVWFDTIEIAVGDSTHRSIESAISEARFFCLAISPAAVESYYVREVEFEQAFSRLLVERRPFTLPIVIWRTDEELIPERIRHLHRLDFVNRKHYAKSMRQLVKKIRGVDGGFTGSRWFKGLNISNLGEPVGVGPVAQKATMGAAYCIEWKDGVVVQVEVFESGKLIHYKEFDFDDDGRVVGNRMYSRGDDGAWAIVDDVWYCAYDPITGNRAMKTMRFLGEATARVVRYDSHGLPTREDIVTDPEHLPDRAFPYASKIFEYDSAGNAIGERWFNEQGEEIPAVKWV
ncbi:hypothetical protein GCM10009554_38990 [Kribbella koreensis]|uniref:TIR domain-containing protein n=1 Tax=Kribbella koreensis TaxID=57909 RepID=A0ABP4B585_9ACTN